MKKLFLMVLAALSFCFSTIMAQNSITYVKKGSGQPVIFLPALGCKGSVWDNTVNKLSKKYCCYEISIAGFGGVQLNGYFSMERISKDIIGLIKLKKLEYPVLIGHSVSGFLALKIASENPGIFSNLIIVDSFSFVFGSIYPSVTDEQAKAQAALLKNMILKESDEQFKISEEKNLVNLVSNKKDMDTVLSWVMSSNRNAIAEATYEMAANDLRDGLKNINCKTLIIGTWRGKEKFGYTKASTEKIFNEQYKNLKNKKIIISDNSKHFIMLDNPGWLNKQITRFISE